MEVLNIFDVLVYLNVFIGVIMRKKMSHKLTKEQKEEILKLIAEGFSPTDIAVKFGVSRITVYNISRKRKIEEPENK